MIVLPAIDILDGKPVRLFQGDYGQSKCVAEDVLACAKTFEKEKATKNCSNEDESGINLGPIQVRKKI